MRGSDFLTVREVAQKLHVSEKRVYQLCAESRLPCTRRGRRLLFPRRAWQRWLDREAERALVGAVEG